MSSKFVRGRDRQTLAGFIEDYQKSSYAMSDGGEPIEITPSPIDEIMVIDHENMIRASLPSLFRAYLMSWCLPDADLYVGQLPAIRPDRPFKWVERWSIEKMDEPFYRRNERLVPFSHGVADCSDVCFDIYRPDAADDYPIINVWHDKAWHTQPDADRVEWLDRDCEQSQIFSNFSDYFDYLHRWLKFKAVAVPGQMFEDWLRAVGKKVRPNRWPFP